MKWKTLRKYYFIPHIFLVKQVQSELSMPSYMLSLTFFMLSIYQLSIIFYIIFLFISLNVNLVSHANQQFILSGLFIGPNLRGVCLMYGELFQ